MLVLHKFGTEGGGIDLPFELPFSCGGVCTGPWPFPYGDQRSVGVGYMAGRSSCVSSPCEDPLFPINNDVLFFSVKRKVKYS